MRHRATRNPLTLLRPRRLRPRRRASAGTAGAGTVTHPGLRLGLAVASVLAVLTGGMVAASQLGGTEVPTGGGNPYADRAGPEEPSRSSGRIAWPGFDAPGTPSTPHRASAPAPAPTSPPAADPPEREEPPSAGDEKNRTGDRSPLDLPSAQVSASAVAPDVHTPSTPTDAPSSAAPRRASGDAPQRPTATPSQDDTPPQTTIVSGPTATNGSALEDSEFVFDASESARFSCSLDGLPFRPCASPQEYDDLDPGRHEFAVRAIDAAGNVDPTPDRHSWVTTGLDP